MANGEEAVAKVVKQSRCVTCIEFFGPDHCYQVSCEHFYCNGCLDDLFRSCLVDVSLYPPRCCRETISFDEIKTLLSLNIRADFLVKKEELDDDKKLYCKEPRCSAYIPHGNRTPISGTCPACTTTRCISCEEAPHEGTCEEKKESQEVHELAEKEGWRSCPACSALIELTIGCNHMTCRCSAQFCYICRLRWKTCTCPQWDENRLMARAHDVAHHEDPFAGADAVAAAARNPRERPECDHDSWARINESGLQSEECRDHLPRYIYRCRQCAIQACSRCRLNRL
ncbi:hypothetical protein BAUCODRAFT_119717 [Baudoinia panamericana UAMH 10762]|uniref:RBR-type E3 ubiquitin transferase n=1 Tax=Baudoinia panamericana (strain UAMH 10762) TaxID=717646 RepID=M2MTB4_BAUPA|nr:uncharacterized protein BAUCODRAFT_119717 [Baudoinia panamericana UAMH 10762]EMD00127.1 hypothetical protein BAUCODRAFT_119717 [Baudoinia panamericana UAMH 10762]